jgi:DNA-binding transcriptional ArsR family regulator
MPEQLPLDADLIDLLASDTRREILGLLKESRMTVTELARELDLRKATVHEHLGKLVDANLVDRDEDDRLWVYYELTPKGKRLLNPRRTRFYLAVGVAVLAAIVAAGAAGMYLAGGGAPGAGDADPTAAAGALEVQATESVAGEPVTLEARSTQDLDGARAYLVPEGEAERLREGDLGARGLPLQVDEAEADRDADAAGEQPTTRTVRLSTAEPVPEGTYHVYVRTEDGADNRASMPAVRVAGVDAELTPRAWNTGLSDQLDVQVTLDGSPVDGTLLVEPTRGESASLSARVVGGQATVPGERVDGLDAGEHRVRVLPDGAARWLDAGRLTVHDAQLAAVPPRAPQGTPAEVAVYATAAGQPVDAGTVRVGGAALERTRVLEDHQLLRVNTTGPFTLDAGRGLTAQLDAPARATATFVAEDGPPETVRVADADGDPVQGAAVRLDGEGLGFTNATGHLAVDPPPEGEHALAVQLPEGATLTRGVQVEGWEVTATDAAVDLRATQVGEHPARTTVEAELTARATTPVDAELTARLDGRPVHAQAVTLDPGEATTVPVPVPVADAGEHRVDLDVDPDPRLTVATDNRTATDAGGDDAGGGGGDVTTEAPAEDEGDATVTVRSGSIEETADAATEAGDDAAGGALEPVGGAGDDAMDAAGEQAETPGPGMLAAVAAGLAALAARRWA